MASAEAEFTDEEKRALKEIAQSYNDGALTRRQALGLVAGGGGLLGAGAAGSLLGTGKAADTAQGDIGSPSNPSDIFTQYIEILDTGTDPVDTGEVRRNGNDVKVRSGGQVQNISNIGSGTTATGTGNDSLYQSLESTPVDVDGSGAHTAFAAVAPIGDGITVFYRNGDQHLAQGSDTLRAVETFDGGLTWTNDRQILDPGSSTSINPLAARQMANGRVGVVTSSYVAGDEFQLVYSDDGGSTWSTSSIPVPGGDYWGMDMQRYPASVGGADDGSAWVVPVMYDSATQPPRIATTTDNGDTWTDQGNAFADVSGESLAEPYIERVGSDDKWVMVLRENANAGSNMFATRSTDLINWEQPVETNVPLLANPPYLDYDNGKFHLIGASREYRSREIGNYGDALLYQQVNASDVYDDLTTWADWSVWDSVDYPLGYIDTATIGNTTMIVSGKEQASGESGTPTLYRADTNRAEGQQTGLYYEDQVSDITGSRSFDTTYQNTDGEAIWVTVSAKASASNTRIFMQPRVGPSSGTVDDVGNQLDGAVAVNPPTDLTAASSTFLVPDDHYYTVRAFGDSADYYISDWYERTWKN